jgi:hypothetical protein
MFRHNCLITIKQMTGSASSKALSQIGTSVKALILPVSNDILALYPNLPTGQAYSILLYSDLNIKPEAEFVVSDALNQEITINSKFILSDNFRKNKVLGRYILNGVCIKQ